MTKSNKDLIQKISTNLYSLSPVVIEGSAETNKSEILLKLCDLLCENGIITNYKIRYSWDILDSLIQALSEHGMLEWKKDFLNSEIIVIEDFQYLKEKTAIAEELYKIFKSANVPVIITTSIPITNKNFYCEDLVAFLKRGTIVNLNEETA